MPASTPPQKDRERVELTLSVEARDHLLEIVNEEHAAFEPKHCPHCEEIVAALSQHTTEQGGDQ